MDLKAGALALIYTCSLLQTTMAPSGKYGLVSLSGSSVIIYLFTKTIEIIPCLKALMMRSFITCALNRQKLRIFYFQYKT